MAGINININKTTGNVQIKIEDKDITQEMMERVNGFCTALLTDSDKFNKVSVFNDILNYITIYDRILYAPISNTIYACYDEHDIEESSSLIGTMNSNIEAVVVYAQSSEFIERKKQAQGEKAKKNLDDTRKVILKIWDHINLAQQQYSMLKQSDEDYKKKFDKSISPFKEELTKDMNSQLLTMVGIFTALAFLIFGGISSLDNIFANIEFPLFKLLIVGALWGLCILNLIFVFLFCVGKMTKLNFKSTDDKNATLFQKYPIVWWSNLIIVSIMVLSIWGYYLTKRNIHNWFDKICRGNPIWSTIIGTGIIIIVIVILTCKLIKATKDTAGNDN